MLLAHNENVRLRKADGWQRKLVCQQTQSDGRFAQ